MEKLLIAMRKEKGLTQSEIATAAGIAQATYSNIETGARRPSVDMAKRIAKVLGFDWTRFFEEEGGREVRP